MAQFQSTIMFPMNGTALILGRRLILDDHDVNLYSPEDVHKRLAHTISADLAFEGLGMSSTVKEVVTLDDLELSNFVIFPTLDVDPSEARSGFASMCKDIFRYCVITWGLSFVQYQNSIL